MHTSLDFVNTKISGNASLGAQRAPLFITDYLELDPEMKVLGAIGKFHLSDHVDSCFCHWSLNFMKGAGHIDWEIMETLWSGMNKVSGAARLMSKAHRQEALDDYMRDSNWKKTVGIGAFCFY